MKPSDIVTNSYTDANNPETENLVQATPEELLHIRRKETVLELYPGCVVTEDPVLDAENMRQRNLFRLKFLCPMVSLTIWEKNAVLMPVT